MRLKLFFPLLLVLLITPISLALTEKFNDVVYDQSSVAIDDTIFKFKISSSGEALTVTKDNTTLIIRTYSCNDDGLIKICVDDIFADQFYSDKWADVQILYHAPNLTIDRTADAETVEAGDKITITLKITNDGDLEAKDVSYIDYYPAEIILEDVDSPCVKGSDNSITYHGELKVRNSINCEYSLRLSKETDQKLKAEIQYHDGFITKKAYSDLLSIKATPLYELKAYHRTTEDDQYTYTALSSADIEVGQEIYLHLNLTNKVSDDLTFKNFTITLPQSMKIIRTNLEHTNEAYSWSGTLDKNTTKEFYFTLIPTDGGNFELEYNTLVEKNRNNLGLSSDKIDYEIIEGELEISSNLDNKTSFDSTKEMYMTFSAKNTFNYTKIISGVASISNTLTPTTTIPLSIIKTNASQTIYQTSIIPKNVSSTETHTIKFEANYTTEFGVTKNVKEEWKVQIKPVRDLDITKTTSKNMITEGDEITVTVKVKNTRSIPVYNVKIEEVFYDEVTRNGKTKNIIDILSPDEEVEVYAYTITAPQVKNETKILITTNVSYYEKSTAEQIANSAVTVFEPLNLTVNPKKADLDITKSADYTTIDLGETVKVTYTIENEDEETAYNLRFLLSQSKEVDLLNEYEYSLDRLDPGETMTFKREVARPKKSGSVALGTMTLYFEDNDGNLFNYTNDALTISVENRTLFGPAIILAKKLSVSKITEDEVFNVTLTAENIGDEDAFVTILDSGRQFQKLIPPKKSENFTYSSKAVMNNGIGNAYAYYKYQGNEYRAYAQAPSLTIDAKKTSSETTTVTKPETSQVLNETKEATAPTEEPGFFKRLIINIKSMFGLN